MFDLVLNTPVSLHYVHIKYIRGNNSLFMIKTSRKVIIPNAKEQIFVKEAYGLVKIWLLTGVFRTKSNI